jgi:organic hydroperoxide reductase OsmC/OhrA
MMKHQSTYVFENTVSQNADEPAKIAFSGPARMQIGPAAEFGGSGQTLNPEELFVAAVNSCLMTTFFYFTGKFDIRLSTYHSKAQGHLDKQSDGFRFTSVTVQAKVQISENESVEKVREAGRLAEQYCLVSRSVACPVEYQLEINVTNQSI